MRRSHPVRLTVSLCVYLLPRIVITSASFLLHGSSYPVVAALGTSFATNLLGMLLSSVLVQMMDVGVGIPMMLILGIISLVSHCEPDKGLTSLLALLRWIAGIVASWVIGFLIFRHLATRGFSVWVYVVGYGAFLIFIFTTWQAPRFPPPWDEDQSLTLKAEE
jgi:hypothetical protein